MAHYLVTGGAGFIGSHLVAALLARGHRVRVLDNFSTGSRNNLSSIEQDIELIEGDVCHYHAVIQAMKGIEVVLHQAALPSVPRSIKDPIATHMVNTNGTLNILHAAVQQAVRRVVYASSSSVYGDSNFSEKVEHHQPTPKSPYAVSKLVGEQYCAVFYQQFGLETVVLRYFNVFGPRQNPNSAYAAVVPRFLAQMKAGNRPVIYGDGTQTRDFTYVENNVNANLAAAEVPHVAGKTMNIAGGNSASLLELVQLLNQHLGKDLQPMLESPRVGDVLHSKANIELAQQLMGFHPAIDFREGLALLVNFEKSNG
jgi:nucleoside-diphosphate-sugar epimerase